MNVNFDKYDFTFFRNKRSSEFEDVLHPFNIKLLKTFLNSVDNINHRCLTRLKKKQQAAVSRLIKQARQLGLLSFGR